MPLTPINQLLLIEADNLDEKGAMSVLRDSMLEGIEDIQSYDKTFERIKVHYERGEKNIMVTYAARCFWKDKQEIVKQFLMSLKRDLNR